MSLSLTFSKAVVTLGLLLAPTLALAANSQYSYYNRHDVVRYGLHPWEDRERRFKHDRIRYFPHSTVYYYAHPDRSQTHGLHPYHRERYYEPPVRHRQLRYFREFRDFQYQYSERYQPSVQRVSNCRNYSYSRPNYRIPPYGYTCQ